MIRMFEENIYEGGIPYDALKAAKDALKREKDGLNVCTANLVIPANYDVSQLANSAIVRLVRLISNEKNGWLFGYYIDYPAGNDTECRESDVKSKAYRI